MFHRVKDTVGLHAIRVADEDPRSAPIVELANVAKLLDERDAAEDAEVADRRRAVVPHLIWRLFVECLGRRAVEQVNNGHHCLTPVDGQYPPLLEEGTRGGHHRLVAALDDVVLLRSVRRGVVELDALVGAVRRELSRRELAAIVRAQHTKLTAILLLSSSLMTLDGVRSNYPGVEEDRPYIAGDIIDEEEEVASASRSSWCAGAVEVAMLKLQLLIGVEAHLMWEGDAPLLHQHARVVELLHVVDVRHAPHHLLGTELPKGLKVQVPKALVPPPCVVVVSSCKAKGLHHLYVENVEAVAPRTHLSEKTATSVLDA
jgi:hypothetical protein